MPRWKELKSESDTQVQAEKHMRCGKFSGNAMQKK